MRVRTISWLGFSLLMAGVGPAAGQAPVTHDDLVRLARWLPGAFDNNQQVHDARELQATTPHQRLHLVITPVDLPGAAGPAFHVHGYVDNDTTRVVRRQVWLFEATPDGRGARLAMLWLPEGLAPRTPDEAGDRLRRLGRDELTALVRCDLPLSRDGDGLLAAFPEAGCRVRLPGHDGPVRISGDVRLASEELRLNDRWEDEAGGLAWGRVDHVPFRLQRARFFECWSVIRREGTEDQYDVARNLLVHDQGQTVAFGPPGGPPSRHAFDLARLKSAQSRVTVLRLAILEQGRAQSVAYVWTEPDATRIGINLRWAQVGCTLKPGAGPQPLPPSPVSAPVAGKADVVGAPGTRPAYLVVQGRLKPGAEQVYARYLEGTAPLLARYGGEVAAVGEGTRSPHTDEPWPIHALLRFPSRQAAEGFLGDPEYLVLKRDYRDAAYDVLRLTLFEGRPPRVHQSQGADTVNASAPLADETARHFRAVIEKRIEEIIDRYWPGDDTYVFVEGPRWSTRGHDRIATGWRAFVNAPLSVRSVEWIEGPVSQIAGEMGWIGGIVELQVEVGGTTKPVRFRGTFVMRRGDDGVWRVVHEHFSQPAADPYGIGDWLPAKP